MENSKVRRWGAEAIAAVQWLIFLVANTVALPVVIGAFSSSPLRKPPP